MLKLNCLKKKKKSFMVVERDRVHIFIYKWRGDKDNHIYKQHILISLGVLELSEQLFRHSFQQPHLPVSQVDLLPVPFIPKEPYMNLMTPEFIQKSIPRHLICF